MAFLPHWPKQTKLQSSIILGTERVLSALNLLGDPHKCLPPVIHVAGTNGKGSTVAYVTNTLTVAGYRVHVNTSPHLIEFNERIVLAGNQISDAMLFQVMEEVRIIAEKHSIYLTMFEAQTVGAFIAYANVPADFLVLEVGMGGRSDATNVFDEVMISIITSISFDHEQFLGNTLPAIAFEKAGIIKPHCPCVIGKQSSDEVYSLLEAYSESMESKTLMYGTGWQCQKTENSILFQSELMTHEFPLPSLIGDHQVDNAGNAIAAIALMKKEYGLSISVKNIIQGLLTTKWPARMELVTSPIIRNSLPNTWKVYLDGAHNNGGAEVLANWAKQQQDPVYLVLGMTKGKDIKGFLSILKPYIRCVCGVCVRHELNSQRGEVVRQMAEELGMSAAAFDYLPSALSWITNVESGENINILICGSLYLAGDIKRIENGLLV